MPKPPPEGTVLAVPLGEDVFGFCRTLRHPLVEFYDTSGRLPGDLDVEEVVGSEVAFRIWAMDSATGGRRWKKVGHVPLSDEEQSRRHVFFRQDALDKKLSTYWTDPQTGEPHEEPADADDVRGLEAAAVWSAEHVEDRLRDHFAGVENKWERSLRLKTS